MELQVGLKNTSEKDADWYMTNEVLKSLEDSQSIAEGGAYGYRLTYVGPDKKETVLYDSRNRMVAMMPRRVKVFTRPPMH